MTKLALLGGEPIGKVAVPEWPIFDGSEVRAVEEVVRSGMRGTNGTVKERFEKAFAEFCHCNYAVSATNGTHTLRLALEVLGVGPGDEVIVPGLTWQATAASVLDVNAVPILVDIDPETYTPALLGQGTFLSIRTGRRRGATPLVTCGAGCQKRRVLNEQA